MQWLPLARRECRTILRSKGTWALVVLIPLWAYRPTYRGWNAVGSTITVAYLQLAATLFLPIGILLLCYRALSGERKTGSMKFLLGLPLTRTHILLGKGIGRFAGIGAMLVVAASILAVGGVVNHGFFPPDRFVVTLLAMLLVAAAFVSVALLVSTIINRTTTATAVVVAFFFVSLFWSRLVPWVYSLVTGISVSGVNAPASGPLFLALRLTPVSAYFVVTNWILGVGNSAALYQRVYLKRVYQDPTVDGQVYAYVVDPLCRCGRTLVSPSRSECPHPPWMGCSSIRARATLVPAG